MDSRDLTRQQAEQIHHSMFPLANWLFRLNKRMERGGFPPDDPLSRKARAAYDATCSLMTELHYASCGTGVGREKRD